MNTRLAVSTTLIVGLTLATTACGSGQEETAAGGSGDPIERIDACSLLTAAEVEAALGRAVAEPMRTEQDGFHPAGTSLVTVCNWDAGGLTDGVALTLRQYPVGGPARSSEEWAEEVREQYEGERSDPDLADLPEIDFLPMDFGSHSAVANVWEDFTVLEVYVDRTGAIQLGVSAPTTEVAEELARTAVSRLPG